MNRDELIKNVEDDTSIGNKIVELQLDYLKAFKRGFLKFLITSGLKSFQKDLKVIKF